MDQNTVGENAGRLAAAGYGDMWGYGEEKVAPELSGRELRRPAGKEQGKEFTYILQWISMISGDVPEAFLR